MSLFRCSKLIVVAICCLAAVSFAKKDVVGRTRAVIGGDGVQYLEKGKNSEKLQTGKKVLAGSQVSTKLECEANIALTDGSTITVEENSLVVFSEMSSDNGANRYSFEIKLGKVAFDAQKQLNKDSRFEFTTTGLRTGTAVAAIRGTDGVFGRTNRGKPFASLRSGKLDIEMGSEKASISGGQAVITVNDKFVVIDLKSSGNSRFMNELDTLMNDTTLTVDSLVKKAKEIDSKFSEDLEKTASEIQCVFEALPDTIYEPKVTLNAKCASDVYVTFAGFRDTNSTPNRAISGSWEPSATGVKKFEVTCERNRTKVHCGSFTTFYAQKVKEPVKQEEHVHTPLTLTTSSPATVCDPAAITIAGTFDPDTSDAQATLVVKLGKYVSGNLMLQSSSGKFSQTINISDKLGNWNETKAEVEYTSKTYGTEKASIDLSVNKSCSGVNIIRPTVELIQSDSLRCNANIALSNIDDDEVIFTANVDGTPSKETHYRENTSFAQSLKSGSHEYTFEAVDLAGNSSSITRTLGCYPADPVNLEIEGGTSQRLRVPPYPGNAKSSFYKVLRFKVKGIPQNDPIYIKRVTIKQDNNSPIILQQTDLQSVSIDQQIELTRGHTSTVTIEVIMKSGKILKATKTYEVR